VGAPQGPPLLEQPPSTAPPQRCRPQVRVQWRWRRRLRPTARSSGSSGRRRRSPRGTLPRGPAAEGVQEEGSTRPRAPPRGGWAASATGSGSSSSSSVIKAVSMCPQRRRSAVTATLCPERSWMPRSCLAGRPRRPQRRTMAAVAAVAHDMHACIGAAVVLSRLFEPAVEPCRRDRRPQVSVFMFPCRRISNAVSKGVEPAL